MVIFLDERGGVPGFPKGLEGFEVRQPAHRGARRDTPPGMSVGGRQQTNGIFMVPM